MISPDGHETWVRPYPLAIDARGVRARSPRARAWREHEPEILRRRREHLILRVDRADLSKNVLRGFTAFDIFLEQHPEFRERVTFIAHLQPSRQDVPEYVEYLEKIEALVAVINHRHGTTDWMPIDLRLRDDFEEAVALYKHFDLLLVNAMWDGMNLVSKEGPLVNTRDGMIILSENTGAHEELGECALSVNPFDVQEQADAIHHALTAHARGARQPHGARCGRSSPRARRPTGSTTSSPTSRRSARRPARRDGSRARPSSPGRREAAYRGTWSTEAPGGAGLQPRGRRGVRRRALGGPTRYGRAPRRAERGRRAACGGRGRAPRRRPAVCCGGAERARARSAVRARRRVARRERRAGRGGTAAGSPSAGRRGHAPASAREPAASSAATATTNSSRATFAHRMRASVRRSMRGRPRAVHIRPSGRGGRIRPPRQTACKALI